MTTSTNARESASRTNGNDSPNQSVLHPEHEPTLGLLDLYMADTFTAVTSKWLCRIGAKAYSLDLPWDLTRPAAFAFIGQQGQHDHRDWWISKTLKAGYDYARRHHESPYVPVASRSS